MTIPSTLVTVKAQLTISSVDALVGESSCCLPACTPTSLAFSLSLVVITPASTLLARRTGDIDEDVEEEWGGATPTTTISAAAAAVLDEVDVEDTKKELAFCGELVGVLTAALTLDTTTPPPARPSTTIRDVDFKSDGGGVKSCHIKRL